MPGLERGTKGWLIAIRAYYPSDEDIKYLCDEYGRLKQLEAQIEKEKQDAKKSRTTDTVST